MKALLTALVLLLAALALPPVELPRDTFDHLIVFDITQSMDVADQELDGAPASRLDYARAALRLALRELPCGSRVGLAIFTQYRTLALVAPIEVCANYNDLLASLASIDGRMRWGNASEISKGVFWSMRVARELGEQIDVIFLTDGHEAPPLGRTDLVPFDDARPGSVRGVLVGVGGLVPRPIPRSDADGKRVGVWRADQVVQRVTGDGGAPSREHLSSLREAHLRTVARVAGFEYARLTDPGVLAPVLRTPALAHRRPVKTDLGWLPAALALALLAWRFAPALSRRHRPGV